MKTRKVIQLMTDKLHYITFLFFWSSAWVVIKGLLCVEQLHKLYTD